MKLTRTDAIFSRTTMVLFLCRNKSSRNGTKLSRVFYTIKENLWIQEPPKVGTWVGTTHQGAPPPPGAPRWVVPTWWPRRSSNQRYKILFLQKKTREKELSRSTRWSRRYLLFFIGRPGLESVRGSGEADSSPSSSSPILHHQFHDAHRCA